jgi:hypothetical protein
MLALCHAAALCFVAAPPLPAVYTAASVAASCSTTHQLQAAARVSRSPTMLSPLEGLAIGVGAVLVLGAAGPVALFGAFGASSAINGVRSAVDGMRGLRGDDDSDGSEGITPTSGIVGDANVFQTRLRDATNSAAPTYRQVELPPTPQDETPEAAAKRHERQAALRAGAAAMLDDVRAAAEARLEDARRTGDDESVAECLRELQKLQPLPPGIVQTSKEPDYQRWIDPNSLR